MIKLDNIKMAPGFDEGMLEQAAAKKLGLPREAILCVKRLRQAVDARRKNSPQYNISLAVDLKPGFSPVYGAAEEFSEEIYRFPFAGLKCSFRPVVAGSGPAGLFCAYMLAYAGLRPILLERGNEVDRRTADVEQFFRCGHLNTESNVQFGEGGAGTFSDGKLTTGTKDIRHRFILEQFFRAGAAEDVTYLAKPHIGTDILRGVVKNIRQNIVSLGGEVRFGTTLCDLYTKGGALRGVHVKHGGETEFVETSALVLATGHSSRDTFEMLAERGVYMEAKNFAVGVRIEHLQREIDRAQYGDMADFKNLPASDYKTAVHMEGARSVFSFCVCPGGSVVGAASENEMLVTNGMSEYLRDGANINGALLAGVTPEDYKEGPLGGIAYQRDLERAAYQLGGGGYVAPAQLVGDFLSGRASAGAGRVAPSYRPGVRFTDIRPCLPEYIVDALKSALPIIGKKIKGFDAEDAVLTAVESRSSSPVRIVRSESFESSLRGLFPCGEGAGYAGGIMSAAADGIRCAEAVCMWL